MAVKSKIKTRNPKKGRELLEKRTLGNRDKLRKKGGRLN